MTYTVKPGDTLYGISNQFGVSVMDIMNLNNLSSTTLRVGEVLKIPTTSGTNPDNTFIYDVKKGDSLYIIANLYDTTVNELKTLNNLTSNNLSIGQKLIIPEKYTTSDSLPIYVNYTIKKGDSLYKIAKEFNVSVDTIIKDNSLNSNNLSIGQNLKIRTTSDVIEECFGEAYTPSDTTNNETYTVQKGDSLYSIAKKFNTTVSDIVRLNNLTSNSLSIGQVLKLPISNNTSTYTVQKGDSLYSIAKKFNTSVEDIKKKNNLISNLLNIGQKLKI